MSNSLDGVSSFACMYGFAATTGEVNRLAKSWMTNLRRLSFAGVYGFAGVMSFVSVYGFAGTTGEVNR